MIAPPVEARRLEAWLQSHQGELVETLRTLVAIESPSRQPDSQAPVFELLAKHLAASGFTSQRYPGQQTGGLLEAWPGERASDRPVQLLIGHCDTVWPLGTLEQMPLRSEEGQLKGPGVYDMKAGLVQLLYALRALRELGVEPAVQPVVLVNSDEEIGSRETRQRIIELARSADRVMVMEPSLGREGRLKTARKGVGRFTVTVRGQAAHAGLDPGAGISAILELSHVIQQLFALNDPQRGITVNVGTIDGGLQANVVAPESQAVVDVRVPRVEDARRLEAQILDLQPTTPGAELEIEGGIGRPPMERTPANQALWRRAQELGRAHGLELEQGMAGGGSDGNFTSQLTATLDGLGAVGDGAHAAHEFIFEDQLLARTALLAQLIASPPLERGEPEA